MSPRPIKSRIVRWLLVHEVAVTWCVLAGAVLVVLW